VLLAHSDDDRLFVEVNPDVYRLAPNALEDLRALADSSHISNRIDWQQVGEALGRKDGIARDVTLPGGDPDLERVEHVPDLGPGPFAQGGFHRFARWSERFAVISISGQPSQSLVSRPANNSAAFAGAFTSRMHGENTSRLLKNT
jgi:hypothetical protein